MATIPIAPLEMAPWTAVDVRLGFVSSSTTERLISAVYGSLSVLEVHPRHTALLGVAAAAEICGTTPKTVKRSVLAARAAEQGETSVVEHNYDAVRDVVVERVERTKGKITAKRLLPITQAAGYEGSPRNFRRLVAEVKAQWRAKNHRGRRPGVWSPGDILVFDWGQIGQLFVFCAVLAW